MTKRKLTAKDMEFFDEDGKPISNHEWVELGYAPFRYRKDKVVNGYRIISYWSGVDAPNSGELLEHGFHFGAWEPNNPPLIFNNILLDPDEKTIDNVRTATKEEAYNLFMQWAERAEKE